MKKKKGYDMKKIKVGVLGVGRGQTFMYQAKNTGMELVAICDKWKERLEDVGKKYKVKTYTDYDKFLSHDMDAIVLANYCHDHAPYAIKALKAGFHVLSECIPARTMAQCVELVETVEQTKKIYMLAENYPYMLGCQELKRVYETGEIGDVRYAEGEYNHPMDEAGRLKLSAGLKHWRNWLPPTYYVTHALAPLMFITDTIPVSLNALSIVEKKSQAPNTVKIGDVGSVILCRMNNGAVFRIWGLMMSSVHRIRYEIHGEKGLALTHGSQITIHHEEWLCDKDILKDRTYTPNWPSHKELAKIAGHGGGDFWVNLHFANAIKTNKQPYLDVYRAAAMAAVSILGWKSCLKNGNNIAIPNFKDKNEREAYRNDDWSPFPEDAKEGQPPASIQGNKQPSKKAIAFAKKIWHSIGYTGE